MTVRKVRRNQTGSALIALLIATLIVAILWAYQHRGPKKGQAAPPSDPTAIESAEDIHRHLDRAKEARDQMSKDEQESQKRMTELDRR